MRNQIEVIFDASVNCEEFLAVLSSDKGFSFSAN